MRLFTCAAFCLLLLVSCAPNRMVGVKHYRASNVQLFDAKFKFQFDSGFYSYTLDLPMYTYYSFGRLQPVSKRKAILQSRFLLDDLPVEVKPLIVPTSEQKKNYLVVDISNEASKLVSLNCTLVVNDTIRRALASNDTLFFKQPVKSFYVDVVSNTNQPEHTVPLYPNIKFKSAKYNNVQNATQFAVKFEFKQAYLEFEEFRNCQVKFKPNFQCARFKCGKVNYLIKRE